MGYRAARDRDPAVRRDLRDGRRRAGILIRVPAGRSSAVLAGGSDGLVPRASTARIDTRSDNALSTPHRNPPGASSPAPAPPETNEPTASRTRGIGGDRWALHPQRSIPPIKR